MRYILVLSTFCIWKNRQRELSSFPKVIVLARIVLEVEFESRKTEFQTSFNKWSLPPPVPAFLLSWESLFIIPQVIQNKFQHFNLTHRALLWHEKLFLFIFISWHFHPWILCWITSNLLTFPIEDAMMILHPIFTSYILFTIHFLPCPLFCAHTLQGHLQFSSNSHSKIPLTDNLVWKGVPDSPGLLYPFLRELWL